MRKCRIFNFSFCLCVAAFAIMPYSALAQSSAVFSGGSITLGDDIRDCDGTTLGALKYDAADDTIKFCDGLDWAVPSGDATSCNPPVDCPIVGNTCTDGSKFAGLILYGANCERLYVADADQGAMRWAGENFNTGAILWDDGSENQQWIVDNRTIATYNAFDSCNNLVRHTRTDWYVPGLTELDSIMRNSTAIGGLNTTSGYWSSTQQGTNNAWSSSASDFNSAITAKSTATLRVRCVRRD